MPPPFGIEQALNAEVTALLAHVASQTQHTSPYKSAASCPVNIKHSNLQLPRNSGGTTQWLIPKRRGSETRPYDESPKSSCHKFCVVMMVSDGFRSTLMWPKFKNFPGGTFPQTPLQRFALYARAKSCAGCACRMAAPNSFYVCPPLLQCLDPPLCCPPPVLPATIPDSPTEDLAIS